MIVYLHAFSTLPKFPGRTGEVFGLHENSDITCAQTEAEDLLGCILGMAPRSGGGGGGSSSTDLMDQVARANMMARQFMTRCI